MTRPVLRRLPALACLLALGLPGLARADEVAGTRSAELVERSHDIRLTLDHGVATLRVRRTVYNGGERHDQAMFWLDVPTEAVATGLRTKGTLHGKDHWFDGDLLEAELAASRYTELTGIGGYYPKDPALLSWRHPGFLALQVFPVAPESDKTVEYTLSMPTRYEGGRDHLVLPPLGTEEHPAQVALHAGGARDQLFLDGRPIATGARITLDAEHTISVARNAPPRIEANLASVAYATDGSLMHWDLALAPRLSTVPRDARVVVLIDGSRSLSEEDRAAAVATARSYLEHFEGSKSKATAEVVVFDHEVHARHGRLVSVRRAMADLEHLSLPEANGSHADAALRRAGELLAKAPKGTGRVLLLTDARTRDALDPAVLETLATRSGALVHVGLVSSGEVFLERDDDHDWSEVARRTGGVLWHLASAPDEPPEIAHEVFEELARPLRVDHLEVKLPPFDDPQTWVPGSLDEGEGLEALALLDTNADHLRIEGELWSQPVRETIFSEAEQEKRWAALIFGSDLAGELSDEEMMPLALLGHAVSPVTSYLAIEPGVRPSTEGLTPEEGGLGLIGTGRGGGGSGEGTIGLGSVGLIGPDRRHETLEREVDTALLACGGDGLAAHVVFETTFSEIVDLPAVEIPDASDPVIGECVTQQLWDVMLSFTFRDEHRVWTIDRPAA